MIIIIVLLVLLFIVFGNLQFNNEHFENNKKYKLTIMAIFKNEEDYLEEWLEHHINQGFEHFYLYCNDPKINKYPYLRFTKYQQYITLIPWVNKKNNGKNTIQRQAYTHCIQNYNKEYNFIMMLDIDEFIVHTDKNKKVIDFINSIYNDWDKTKAIKIQRYDFGSDGHIKKPEGKVTDNYKTHEKICSSYKTIANSDYIDTKKNFYGVHDFWYLNKKKGKVYNSYFSYIHTGYPNGCKKENINEVPLIINHYYTKSYNEYLERCKLWDNGGINTIGYRKDCKNLFIEREKKILEK
jgi:hypothetical protein